VTSRRRIRQPGLCPPHHFFIDSQNYGRCTRPGCGVERDFAILQEKTTLSDEMRELKKVLKQSKRSGKGGQGVLD